jgi:AcrR family transcriptional regulator
MAAYRSERRQRQAEATRGDILRAARRLFAERGYAGTSMAQVAEQAGVAVQTIYASCGSKRDLMFALVDLVSQEADVATLGRQSAASEDPHEVIEFGVRLTRQLNERCGDIVGALLSAEAVEPEAAVPAEEGRRRHREGCARAARKLASLGALREGVTVKEATAIMETFTWHPVYAQLTGEHGWSFDDCERWLREMLEDTLLARS